MTNRLDSLFRNQKEGILSVYYTAGYPGFDDTVRIAIGLEKAGVDLIEIGIPFSDPVADGPVIQESNKIALDNGMTVKKLLEQISEIRKVVSMPIILMGYLNPVFQFGVERFCKEAAESGVDGLIIPDMPMDVYEREYKAIVDLYNLRNTFLISPTTSEERIRKIDEATNGFIYAVSSSSTTGARSGFSSDQEAYFARLKNMKLTNPFLIGFGISNHETFSTACKYGSGAIVGSSFITMLKEGNSIADFVSKLRN
jgi:tryptophan synthase alpha chain